MALIAAVQLPVRWEARLHLNLDFGSINDGKCRRIEVLKNIRHLGGNLGTRWPDGDLPQAQVQKN